MSAVNYPLICGIFQENLRKKKITLITPEKTRRLNGLDWSESKEIIEVQVNGLWSACRPWAVDSQPLTNIFKQFQATRYSLPKERHEKN
jgi:hypothetical protein